MDGLRTLSNDEILQVIEGTPILIEFESKAANVIAEVIITEDFDFSRGGWLGVIQGFISKDDNTTLKIGDEIVIKRSELRIPIIRFLTVKAYRNSNSHPIFFRVSFKRDLRQKLKIYRGFTLEFFVQGKIPVSYTVVDYYIRK